MKLMELALQLLLEEERRAQQTRIIEKVEKPILVESRRTEREKKRTIINRYRNVNPPLKLVDVQGSGRLIEAVVKLSTENAELSMIVDDEEHKLTLDEIKSISPFTEEIIYVPDEKTLALKNIFFEKRLSINVNSTSNISEAYAKVEKYEWS